MDGPGAASLFNFSHVQRLQQLNSSTSSLHATMSIDKLFPALVECFGIILCGYIAGRTNIVTGSQAEGLGNFVSKFALPALLFKNMVLLDFAHVIWPFLWSVLVAKVCVFAVVCALTLVVSSPDSRFSKAGIFSIFATQSNDFALGYPIVQALYQSTHPEYLQYIYLVAPVSLVLLNPVGFTLCEIQKWRDQENQQQSKLRVMGHVVAKVLKNPIVFMVIIGITAHFLLHRNIPPLMAKFLDGLANSFGGAALFYLGLTMVGQLGKLTRSTVVTLILLITAKLLLMPLICKDMVDLLNKSNSSSANHSGLSNYAFLYGVFPTAPSVGIYAVYYNTELQVVTSGLVIGTLLSAPIMYVSAWLLSMPSMDSQVLMNLLQNVSFNISIVSLVALVWTIAVMFLSKKFRQLPHLFTLNLFLAQFLSCIGMITWNFVVKAGGLGPQILIFALLSISFYSTFMWTGLIALSLVLVKRFEDVRVSTGLLVIAGWGIPVLITATLLLSEQRRTDVIDPFFFYGKSQIICTTVVVALSILLAGGSMVCLSRGSWTRGNQVQDEDSTADLVVEGEPELEPQAEQLSNRACLICDCGASQPMPDMIISANMSNTTATPPTDECGDGCDVRDCLLVQSEELQQVADRQVARHLLLCLLLTVILLVNLSSCVWLLLNSVASQLYLELQFFCAVANYGQGLLSFVMFGLDKHLIILPFKKRLARLVYGKKQDVPSQAEPPEEVKLTCTQFLTYHKAQCCEDIVKKRWCGKSRMVSCFFGCDLVAWLQRVGLAQDRGEAVRYGTRLQQGGVVQHINLEHDFQDSLLYYRFIS